MKGQPAASTALEGSQRSSIPCSALTIALPPLHVFGGHSHFARLFHPAPDFDCLHQVSGWRCANCRADYGTSATLGQFPFTCPPLPASNARADWT